MKKLLLVFLLCCSAWAGPQIITEKGTSAWGITSEGNLTTLQYMWSTNMGLWYVVAPGELMVFTNSPTYDLFFVKNYLYTTNIIGTNTNVVVTLEIKVR